MQQLCRLLPPPTLTAHPKNATLETRRGCRHDNLVSTLGVIQCDPPPLALKNPSFAPVIYIVRERRPGRMVIQKAIPKHRKFEGVVELVTTGATIERGTHFRA